MSKNAPAPKSSKLGKHPWLTVFALVCALQFAYIMHSMQAFAQSSPLHVLNPALHMMHGDWYSFEGPLTVIVSIWVVLYVAFVSLQWKRKRSKAKAA